MTSADARRLSLILLFAPFFLWIAVLIVLPQLGIVGVSLREKVGPGEYVFGFANYMDFLGQPIYWNTLLRTAVMSILVTAGHGSPPRAGKRQSRLHLPGDGELGTLALLLAFGLLAGPQGGYGFETIRAAEHSPLVVALVLGLMLLGAGSKAGLVPLHVWLPLVVLGQFSFLTTITSLVIAARLRKFDIALEEAALNLGAGRGRVLATITIPYLMPALVSAFIVAFLVSFENFNTTLMLVGSEAPLTITMYDRVAKVGSTPVLNAVSPSSA